MCTGQATVLPHWAACPNDLYSFPTNRASCSRALLCTQCRLGTSHRASPPPPLAWLADMQPGPRPALRASAPSRLESRVKKKKKGDCIAVGAGRGGSGKGCGGQGGRLGGACVSKEKGMGTATSHCNQQLCLGGVNAFSPVLVVTMMSCSVVQWLGQAGCKSIQHTHPPAPSPPRSFPARRSPCQ